MKNKTALLMISALIAGGSVFAEGEKPAIDFEPLPYAFDALEPHIDARTMEIHYTRHHQAYFNNLLKAVEGTDLAGQTLEQIFANVETLPAAVRNNGGGHWNHTMFWKVMSPDGGSRPEGLLASGSSKISVRLTSSVLSSPRRRPRGSAAGGRGCARRRTGRSS